MNKPANTAEIARQGLANLKRMNLPLLLLVAAAICCGVLFIYGTGQQSGGNFAGKWAKQLIWVALGTTCMFGFALIDYRWLGRFAWGIYGLSVLSLILVLIVGREINGAKSWIGLGPFTFQPSEFGKFGVIALVSYLASRTWLDMKRLPHVFLVLAVAAVPFGLIMLQPDLGSASVIGPITLVILFISGLRVRWLVVCFVLGAAMVMPTWHYGLRPHQKARIWTFVYPLLPASAQEKYEAPNITDEAWNAHQSLLAVGSGGVRGKGFMQGTQNALGFLPRTVAPTDFIFAVVAEETGFIGSTFLLAVFWGIMMTCVLVAIRAPDPFGRNIACGIGVLFCTHVYINIGMTIGMAPIIGIPLPFVSSGGTFMLFMLSGVGVLQSIYIRRDTGEGALELADA
ncbi:MAG: rod shape determining protein RodA [Rhodothermales bacterium]|jgi:rod shape determining protein RodA